MFAGTFTHGGRFSKRVGPVMGGHVFIDPNYAWRGKADLQNSGVYIPDEMLQGATEAALMQVMGEELKAHVTQEIEHLMGMPGL